jgi:predicted lysophospholipase L1 biosynthesis ABC-type transport system permease subunit
MLSQTIAISSIYSIVWKYEININDYASFFKNASIYSFFIAMLIITIATALSVSLYIFSENGRMFATLRIFGARKRELLKLIALQMVIYSVISAIISFIELTILYLRYRPFLQSVSSNLNFLESLKNIYPTNIIIIIIFIGIATISSSILIQKDPYQNLRGTL